MLAEICGESFITVTPGTQVNVSETKTLNETGILYWHMLEKGMSTEDMLDSAAKEYEVSPDKIKPGLEAFLIKLRDMGFIEEA